MSTSFQYDLLPIPAFARSNGDLVFVHDGTVIVLSPKRHLAEAGTAGGPNEGEGTRFAADVRGVYEVAVQSE